MVGSGALFGFLNCDSDVDFVTVIGWHYSVRGIEI